MSSDFGRTIQLSHRRRERGALAANPTLDETKNGRVFKSIPTYIDAKNSGERGQRALARQGDTHHSAKAFPKIRRAQKRGISN